MITRSTLATGAIVDNCLSMHSKNILRSREEIEEGNKTTGFDHENVSRLSASKEIAEAWVAPLCEFLKRKLNRAACDEIWEYVSANVLNMQRVCYPVQRNLLCYEQLRVKE